MLKYITTGILTFLIIMSANAQKNATEQAIVDEGIALYKSEMASWHGTDIFREKAADKMTLVGGYLSYTEDKLSKCIFFDQQKSPEILATISFTETFNLDSVVIDSERKEFTGLEKDLFEIRLNAIDAIQKDTLFKHYDNTRPNIIPLIRNGEKKVFVITGPQDHGIVIFGNDYLLTFDENNKVVSKKQIHQNIIPIEYGNTDEGNELVATVHSHSAETGEHITSTDICTLMLYAKYANWKQHMVVSDKYVNIWTCASNSLAVIPADAFKETQQAKEEFPIKVEQAKKKKSKRKKKSKKKKAKG